jgi:cytochrome b561
MLRNTTQGWGTPAKLLHWLMAVLIFNQIALGWLAVSWRLSPTKLNLFVWHKSFGMLILVLVLLRLLWRLANPTPALPTDTLRWEHAAARASHFVLYLLMIVMPISGWIINSAANIPFKVFWLIPLPAIVAPDKDLADLMKQVHLWLFITLSVVLVAHIGAALRHHFAKRNDVLTRMLPDIGGKI